MDFLGIIISYIYIGLVIVGAKIFEKIGKEASRKFIHIMLGNWWIIAMYFFTNVWSAIFVPITFVIINYLSYKNNLIKVMERDEQDGLGTVYYAVALLVLAIISFGIFKKPVLGLVPTLVMAYGDGFAAVIGKKIKSKKYKLGETKKSFAGSLTMFVISSFLIGAYFAFTYGTAFWLNAHWPVVSILAGFAITALEAVSGKGWDNITVPVATVVLLILL